MPSSASITFSDGSKWWADSACIDREPVVCVPISAIDNLDDSTLIERLRSAKRAAMFAQALFMADSMLGYPNDVFKVVEDDPESFAWMLQFKDRSPAIATALELYEVKQAEKILRETSRLGIRAKRAQVTQQRQPLLSALAERDGGLFCQHWGATADLAIDHVKPLARGGTNDLANLQILCKSCNSRKRDK